MEFKGDEQSEAAISKSDYEALAAFRYALRQFLHFSEEAAQGVGLAPQHHQALLVIRGLPGRDYATVGELAEHLQIKHHSAVGLVDRLVLQELVTRQHAASDRRQVHVTLTPHGEEMLAQLSTTHREELRRIGPQLNLLLQRLTEAGEATEEGENRLD